VSGKLIKVFDKKRVRGVLHGTHDEGMYNANSMLFSAFRQSTLTVPMVYIYANTD